MFTFKDLQDEVLRRATRDQGGTQFDTAIKNIINTSLFRIARTAKWRQLRRTDTFETIVEYTTGSGGGTFTNGSKNVTIVGATFLTDNIQVGRRITLQGDSREFTIKTITGETTLTIDIDYNGTTISGTGTYAILAQEEYNLPVQSSHRVFLWHEQYGRPFQLGFITDQSFFGHGIHNTTQTIPTHYRMWGEDMVIEQLKDTSVITVSSSSSSDTNISIIVFGTVGGFPDTETIVTNSSDGTTTVAGNKSFTKVERVVKASSTVGRISAGLRSLSLLIAVST